MTNEKLENTNMEETQTRPGVWIKTFGCQMNEYDSEKMLLLMSASHQRVSNPEDAEVLLVNTCSVREKGEHKLFSLLGSLRELKLQNPEKIIGVSGCVAQQEGNAILKRSPEVDFVIGTHNLSLLPSMVARSRSGKGPRVAIDYRDEWEELPDDFDAYAPVSRDGSLENPVRALIAIQRGCNKHCSFCVVPNTRGPQVSRTIAEILKEVRIKVLLGAKEVLLLGQTVNSYGLDLNPRMRFEQLIRSIADIEGVKRIRFTSPHPQEVKKGFIDLYGEVPQLCPHIHLPLQSGSDRILKLMNRNYHRERYLDIIAAIRERCPEIAVSTDLIVGFPTETEEDFEATLDVMRKVHYNTSYSFKYSRRPHTEAIVGFALADEIDDSIASERLQTLMKLQTELSTTANKQFLGREVEVLVEGRAMKISSSPRGRIPENTLVELVGPPMEVGTLVKARVFHSSPYGLRAEVVNKTSTIASEPSILS